MSGPTVVLCSGGLDSTAIATDLALANESIGLCFVDYGQPAASAEHRSVNSTAERLRVPVFSLHVRGLAVPQRGEIAARNLVLVSVAAAARPEASAIALGIHDGSGYRDCTPAFVELMQRVLDFHSDGQCQLLAPFLTWSKHDVAALAVKLRVPIELTHSCETADVPCGTCRSCRDREVAVAA
jgi:7-cyano-7-deazaguanine synthase